MSYAPYSHSRIQTFTRCPLSFKYSYIMKDEARAEASILKVGSGLHEFMEEYVKHLVQTKQQTDLTFARAKLQEIADLYIRDEVRSEILEEGEKVIDWFFVELGELEYFNATHIEEQVAVNADYEWTEYDSDDAFLRGKVDRWWVDKSHILTVIDYKFGFKDSVPDIQTKIYAYLLLIQLKAQDIKVDGMVLSVWNMRFRKFNADTITDFDALEKEVKGYIEERVGQMEGEKDFDANVGNGCTTCFHRYYCKELNNPDNEAAAMVSKYLITKEETKALEAKLKSYVGHNGNIMYDGKQFGFYAGKPTKSYDGKGIWDWIVEHANDENAAEDLLNENFHLNHGQAEKIARKLSIDILELEKLATEKKRKSFGFLPE